MTDIVDLSAVLDVWEADLAETERLARAAATQTCWRSEERPPQGTGNVRPWWIVSGPSEHGFPETTIAEMRFSYPLGAERTDAEHIVRHDPASVLASVARDRAVITMLRGVLERHDELHCPTCSSDEFWVNDCPDYAAAVAVINQAHTTQEAR